MGEENSLPSAVSSEKRGERFEFLKPGNYLMISTKIHTKKRRKKITFKPRIPSTISSPRRMSLGNLTCAWEEKGFLGD